jgi:N-acyl-D-aspartate/D-glutamate deacylase
MNNRITRRQFIDKSLKGAALLGAGGSYLLIRGCDNLKEFDMLISGGIVYDGLGNPGQDIDIAIREGRIVRTGTNLKSIKTRHIIDAKGLVVCPGFIDVHTHSDIKLLANPRAESHIRQGITTEIGGNCGSSPFPLADLVFDETKKRFKEQYNVDLDWNDINGFFRRLESNGIALNFATLVGFGNIRGKVIGYDDQPATEDYIIGMKKLLEENMLAGAIGLSTGLEYTPDSYAKTEEISELCRIVSNQKGVYATHMRDEGDRVLEAIDETLIIAKASNVSLQISHLKTAYPGNWHKNSAVLAKLEEAKESGIRVNFDRYPYIAGSTSLDFYFPNWAKQGTTAEFISRLKDPALDEQFRSHLKMQEEKLGSWDKVVIASVYSGKNKPFEGKNILEASSQSGKSPYEFMRDIIIDEDDRIDMVVFNMSEDNLKKILAHPFWMPGSDGSAIAPSGILGVGKPHPRFYGTFPRILGKYVREEKVLTLPEAIKKMTSTPALKFGFKHRGQIAEDYWADIVVFNPDTVIDKATWTDPHQFPEGIEYVLVNGEIAVNEGEQTDLLPGKILKKNI